LFAAQLAADRGRSQATLANRIDDSLVVLEKIVRVDTFDEGCQPDVALFERHDDANRIAIARQ